MKHLPALDGIRAFAILIVVFSHVITPVIPGGFGVTLFFFVSGFIITRMMIGQSFGGGHLKAFYVRRFFRLAPALFVYLIIAGLVMRQLGYIIPRATSARPCCITPTITSSRISRRCIRRS